MRVQVNRQGLGDAELTVGISAHNCENHISWAIESILRQERVSFELVIVDDGSVDRTSQIVLSFKDPRIKTIRQSQRRGNAYCQNIIIRNSVAPFITFVKPFEFVLPGGLEHMVTELKSCPTVGQVYCYGLGMDENNDLSLRDFRQRKARVLQKKNGNGFEQQDLIVSDSETFALRTYPREVFHKVGLFDETLRHEYEHEMTLRILSHYEARLIPWFLCWFRKPKANGFAIYQQKLRTALETAKMVVQFSRGRFPHAGNYNVPPIKRWLLVRIGKGYVNFHPQDYVRGMLSSSSRRNFRLRLRVIKKEIYEGVVSRLSRWPISVWKGEAKSKRQISPRVAYYLFRFPVLSQTFIQREIIALRNAGVSVEVVADEHGDLKALDHAARDLVGQTSYMLPIDRKRAMQYFSYFLLRSPLSFVNLFLYIVGRQYQRNKSFREDIRVFLKAVYLAGFLKDKQITRVHAPWANRLAFVALIAAKLLRLPFTLQARASDIHQRLNAYALEEKCSNAQMVLTNTRFNQNYLKHFLPEEEWSKIRVIYNGLDLPQFVPVHSARDNAQKLTILSVARLIEPKGLVYLLGACRLLREKGYRFHCEIIGGQNNNYVAYYVRIKKLRREFGLEEWVTFAGAQPFNNVLERYKSSDIFVLPCVTAQDGSKDITPNALIEAMAMKLPVISTKATAIPEIVDDGVNGILVQPNDEQALGEALMKLMDDSDLRQRLGEQGRRKVEERFDINKNVYRWAECFGSK